MQVLRAKLRSTDHAQIRQQLQEIRSLGFHDQPAVIDVSGLAAGAADDADWDAIIDGLCAGGLKPIAFTGIADVALRDRLSDRMRVPHVDAASLGARIGGARRGDTAEAAAEASGASGEPRAGGGSGRSRSAASVEPASSEPAGAESAGAAAGVAAAEAAASASGAPAGVTDGWQPPLVIHRQVRSGQQIYARQRDLLVLASVSAGAEVIADGNVTCYGQLRGRAIAGASGKADAYIHTLDFEPELVAVAGLYMTFEAGPPAMPPGRIVQVRMDADGERLIIEAV
ncbi:MAG TPA: septum site-determining protein MinC [Burkholderiaceae bacterium]|nr:septum site-determining protein MinC [Burkholderiaceae bacterium]